MSAAPKRNDKTPRWVYVVHDVCKFFAALPGLVWLRPKIRYVSKEAKKRIRGGALVICNHATMFDPVYVMYAIRYRRHHFICLKELTEGKFGWLLKLFLCIPIDRENFSMASFREITGHLSDGHLVSMFPEGHISTEENAAMGTFKSGMVLMAAKSKAPIIPVYIHKRKHFWNRFTAVIGEPVDIAANYGTFPSFAQIEEITQLLYEKEKELEHFMEKGE